MKEKLFETIFEILFEFYEIEILFNEDNEYKIELKEIFSKNLNNLSEQINRKERINFKKIFVGSFKEIAEKNNINTDSEYAVGIIKYDIEYFKNTKNENQLVENILSKKYSQYKPIFIYMLIIGCDKKEDEEKLLKYYLFDLEKYAELFGIDNIWIQLLRYKRESNNREKDLITNIEKNKKEDINKYFLDNLNKNIFYYFELNAYLEPYVNALGYTFRQIGFFNEFRIFYKNNSLDKYKKFLWEKTTTIDKFKLAGVNFKQKLKQTKFIILIAEFLNEHYVINESIIIKYAKEIELGAFKIEKLRDSLHPVLIQNKDLIRYIRLVILKEIDETSGMSFQYKDENEKENNKLVQSLKRRYLNFKNEKLLENDFEKFNNIYGEWPDFIE